MAPAGSSTRPTSDRVREATFNALTSMGVVEGAQVLDLFAGSGAMSVEAVSRGAAGATCVERDRVALDALRRNVSVCALLDEITWVCSDVDRWLDRRLAGDDEDFDLAVIDPPYSFDDWDALLARVPAAVVVIESDRAIDPPEPWDVQSTRTHGGTVVTIATRSVGSDATEAEEMSQ